MLVVNNENIRGILGWSGEEEDDRFCLVNVEFEE